MAGLPNHEAAMSLRAERVEFRQQDVETMIFDWSRDEAFKTELSPNA